MVTKKPSNILAVDSFKNIATKKYWMIEVLRATKQQKQ